MRFLFLLLSTVSLAAKPLELEVHAASAILMNADTGAILFEKHAHVPAYPASITKVATALYVLEQGEGRLEEKVTVSAEALKQKEGSYAEAAPHWLEKDGTMMWLLKGEVLTKESLLYGLLLVSGNDAANVLAEATAGTVPAFVEGMNHYLQQIGCQRTFFQNPHGLHHPEHITTAYDMCLIMKKALEKKTFRQVLGTVTYQKPKTNKQPAKEMVNTNPMIKPGTHFYPKALGGKSGFHSNAKSNMICVAEHEGRTLIAVVLGCENRKDRYTDTKRLFEAAFAEQKVQKTLIRPDSYFRSAIQGAPKPLRAALQKELSLTFYPSEEPSYKAYVHWDIPSLPIQKGQKVGEVIAQDEQGMILQKEDLFALETVESSFFHQLKSKLGF